jgi:hypothetical protein
VETFPLPGPRQSFLGYVKVFLPIVAKKYVPEPTYPVQNPRCRTRSCVKVHPHRVKVIVKVEGRKHGIFMTILGYGQKETLSRKPRFIGIFG